MIFSKKGKKFNYKSNKNLSFSSILKRAERLSTKNFYAARKITYIGSIIESKNINLYFHFLKERINIFIKYKIFIYILLFLIDWIIVFCPFFPLICD